MSEPRALQHVGDGGNDARSAAGDGGTILAVPNIAGAEFSRAAAGDGKSGAADQGREFSTEDLVAKPEFAALAGVVADVEASAGALVAKDGDAALAGERVARQLRPEGVARDEEMGVANGLVKPPGCQVREPAHH